MFSSIILTVILAKHGVLVAKRRIYTVSNEFHSLNKLIIDNQRLIKKAGPPVRYTRNGPKNV